MRAPGLAAPVQLRRDASDVTHIEAQSRPDAYFALGWVHAQERGWQLEFNRRVMHGELSEVLGAATLETDKLMRTLGIMRAAQAQWERLPADAQGPAAGLRRRHQQLSMRQAGQALPPEFHILGARPGPWQPQDSMGWALMMALDLGGNWGNEFARLSALQRIDTRALWQLMPPYPGEAPATAVDLAALYRGWACTATEPRPPPPRPGRADRCAICSAAGSRCRMREPINDWARGIWATPAARAPTTGWWPAATPKAASRCWPTIRTWG